MLILCSVILQTVCLKFFGWNLSSFTYIRSCHLSIKVISLLPFQNLDDFYLFSMLTCSGSDFQYYVEQVTRMSILVPDLREKLFSFSALNMMLIVHFSYLVFIKLYQLPLQREFAAIFIYSVLCLALASGKSWPLQGLEIFLSFQYFLVEFEKFGVNSSLKVGQNSPVKLSGYGLFFVEKFLIIDSISFLVIGLLKCLFTYNSVSCVFLRFLLISFR